MSAITIASISLDVTDGPEADPIPIGEESRAFAGNLRSSIRDQKRQFSVTTAPTLESTWDSLRAACAMGAQVSVSGDVLSGDTITASCKVSGKAIPGLPGFFYITVNGQEV